MHAAPRTRAILNILIDLEDNQHISVSALAEKIGVSRRTMYRELDEVRYILNNFKIELQSVSNKGIRLEADPKALEELKENLFQDQQNSFLDKETRRRHLAYDLLQYQELPKLISFASKYQVSETTIANDIDSLKDWLKSHRIEIIRRKKSRLFVSAGESSRREALRALVHEELQTRTNSQTLEINTFDFEELVDSNNGIWSLLDHDILKRVIRQFHAHPDETGLTRYAQSSVIGLIIHLVISIERIQKNQASPEFLLLKDLIASDSWKQAETIAKLMSEEFVIQFPESEIGFIALHLEGAKVNQDITGTEDIQIDLMEMIHDLIESFEPEIAMVLISDQAFINGLLTHLKPVLMRISHQMPIYNPLLESLKEQYHDLFETTKQAVYHLEDKNQLCFSDEEIGFITIHVGAALERSQRRKKQRRIQIGIVCASGIGISSLLKAKADKLYSASADISAVSLGDVKEGSYSEYDFLISTLDLRRCPIPWIKVSPLLNESNQKEIQNLIDQLLQNPLNIRESDKDSNEQGDNENTLSSRFLTQITKKNEAFQAVLDIDSHLQSALVPDDSSPEQIIQSAALLLEGDAVQLEKDLLQREKLGSITANEYGFVMFHAQSAAVQSAQTIFLYPENHSFTHSKLRNIDTAVVSILPSDHTASQQDALSILSMSLIEDEGYLKAIRSRNLNQIRIKIENKLQQELLSKTEI